MKIALISPKGISFGRFQSFQNFIKESKYFKYYQHLTGLNTNLLIIAALTPPSFEIDLIDENYENIDFNKKYDLIGITGMTQQATRAYEIADEFLKRGIKVVIGGIHATLLPKEAKSHADSVVIGEAEYIWPVLLEDFKNNKLKEFYKSDKLVDLKESPIPRYDLLNPNYYRVVWVQATRGCPRDCEFCAASKVYGKKYRHKNVKQVIEEIRYSINNLGNVQIGFADDNLFLNRNHSIKLLKEITPLKIRWDAQTDISIAKDDELLDLLRVAGCFSLLIGFESLSMEDLKSIDKYGWKLSHLSKYSEYIQKIQSHGIGVHGAFIIGFDSDDSSVFEKVSNYIIENNLYGAQITIMTPLPGTRLRERLSKEKRLLPTKWENYTFIDMNFIHKNLSKEEIENGVLEMYKKIYNRSINLKRMLYFKEIQKELCSKLNINNFEL